MYIKVFAGSGPQLGSDLKYMDFNGHWIRPIVKACLHCRINYIYNSGVALPDSPLHTKNLTLTLECYLMGQELQAKIWVSTTPQQLIQTLCYANFSIVLQPGSSCLSYANLSGVYPSVATRLLVVFESSLPLIRWSAPASEYLGWPSPGVSSHIASQTHPCVSQGLLGSYTMVLCSSVRWTILFFFPENCGRTWLYFWADRGNCAKPMLGYQVV